MFCLAVAARCWLLVAPMNPDDNPEDSAAAMQAAMRWAQTGFQTSDLCYCKPDTGHYLQMSFALAEGDFRFTLIGSQPHRTILLSVLLAPLLAIFGPGLMPLKLANAMFGAALVFPMYLLGRDLFDRRVGLLAAALSVTLHFYVRHSVLLYAEALYMPLYVTAVWLMFRALRGRTPFWAVGGVVGIAYLARASALMLGGGIGMVLLIHTIGRMRARLWLSLGAYVLACGVAASPLALIKILHGLGPLDHGMNNANLWAETHDQLLRRPDECTRELWLARHDGSHDPLPTSDPLQPTLETYDRLPWYVEAPRRFGYGIAHTFWEGVPDEYGHFPNILGGLTLLLLLLVRRRHWPLLVLFILLALPTWWVTAANPTERLLWGTLGPILTLLTAYGVWRIWDLARARSIGAGLWVVLAWALVLLTGAEGFVPDRVHWIAPAAALGLVFVSRELDGLRRRRAWLMVPLLAVVTYLAYRFLVWPGFDWQAKRLLLAGAAAVLAGGMACLPRIRDRLGALRVAPLLGAVFLLCYVGVMAREAHMKTLWKAEDYRQTLARMQFRADRTVPDHPYYVPPSLEEVQPHPQ